MSESPKLTPYQIQYSYIAKNWKEIVYQIEGKALKHFITSPNTYDNEFYKSAIKFVKESPYILCLVLGKKCRKIESQEEMNMLIEKSRAKNRSQKA
jgi:hypothetical protein